MIVKRLKLDRITQSSVLARYIVTYATMLFLPCLILGLFFFNRATTQIRQNALSSQQYNADQISKSLSSEFDQLLTIITQITANKTLFWPSLWKDDIYNRTVVSQELQRLKQFSSLPGECILVYRRHDTVFTSTLNDNTESFFQKFRIGEEISDRILNTANTWTLLSTEVDDTTSGAKYRALLYVLPFHMEKILNNDMVMVYVIPAARLDQWTRRYFGSQDYRLYLFDKNDELLLSYGSYPGDAISQVMNFNSGEEKQRQIDSGSRVESLLKLSIDQPVLHAVVETPWDGTMLQLIEFRSIFLIISATTFVLGFMLVILFSYYNYTPLKRILTSLKKQAPSLMTADTKNEYSQLDSAVNAAITSNRTLAEHINRQARAIYLEILSELLTGAVQYGKIDKTFDICTNLPGPYYCVLAVQRRLPDQESMPVCEFLPTQPDGSGSTARYTIVDVPSYHCTAVVLSLENHDAGCREARVKELYRLFAPESSPYMGVSHLHESIGELSQCMIEAILSLKFMEDREEPGIQYYKDALRKQIRVAPIPDTMLYSFTQSLKCGIQEQCIGIFDDMMDTIETFRNPIVSQIQCYDIANTVLRIIDDIAVDGVAVEIDFLELYRDIDSFRNRMRLILSEVCRCILCNRDHLDHDPFSVLLKYVNDHYLEYDLSLEKLATDFNLSITMVSKLFKQHTGTGFKEYLVKKRLDAARHLLCSTTMSVNEITTAVGYTNESAFIKRFRGSDGMTPVQYRKRYGHV